jgi:hypothetical protein
MYQNRYKYKHLFSISFTQEEKMTNRRTAEYICSVLRDFMEETDTVITSKDLDIQPNFISFVEKSKQG